MRGPWVGLLIAIGLTGLNAPAASATPIRECGNAVNQLAYNITTRVVGCGEARRVVKAWNSTVAQQGGSGQVRGLTCRYRDIAYEAGDIRCTGSRGRVVHWQTAS